MKPPGDSGMWRPRVAGGCSFGSSGSSSGRPSCCRSAKISFLAASKASLESSAKPTVAPPPVTGASRALCEARMVGMREKADSCERIVGMGTPFPSLPASDDAMLLGEPRKPESVLQGQRAQPRISARLGREMLGQRRGAGWSRRVGAPR